MLPVKWGKYLSIFNISVLHTLSNYKLLIGLSFFKLICLLIFAHIWKVAAARVGAIDLDPSLLLWYIAFNEWILIAVPDIEKEIELEVKSGQLAYFLPRPISYLGSKLAEGLGALFVNMTILGLVGFGFTYYWTGLIPLPWNGFLLLMLFGILGGILSLIFTMTIGVFSFYVNEVEPWRWVWEKLLFVLGGLMLPLTVYPLWIQNISFFTPFPWILGGRSDLLFNYEVSPILSSLSFLLFWILVGFITLYILYQKGLKKLNVDGG